MQHPIIEKYRQQGRTILRPREVTTLFCISEHTVRRWAKEGRLQAAKLGKGFAVTLQSVSDLWDNSLVTPEKREVRRREKQPFENRRRDNQGRFAPG